MRRYRHYELTTILGEGKTGQTWQALDTGFERPAVLKFVSGDLSVGTRALMADASDMANARQLRLAPVHGIEDGDEGTVIVRGYIDGQSVKALSQRRMLSFDEFITMAINIATAVKSLHDVHLTHGNLTADNIIVTDSGEVWLTDPGLWPENATVNLRVLLDRDLVYAAPEMLDGATPSMASDLYMLGIVYYELLTGRLPFTLDDREFLLAAVRHDPPNFENDATLRMASEGRLMIQKLLAKKPEDRFGSADELLATLEAIRAFRKGESVTEIDDRPPWTARQYVLVAGVVAILLLYWLIYSQVVR